MSTVSDDVAPASCTSEESKESGWKLLFPLYWTCLVIFGFAFSNILHFCIEDVYNQPIVGSLLFGSEYAISMSWLLMMVAIFYVLSFYERRLQIRKNVITDCPSRRFFLILGIVSFLLVSCFYGIQIVYGFFSGKADVVGLYRVLITILINLLGCGYAVLVLKYSKGVMPKIGFYFIYLCVMGCTLVAFKVTYAQANPKMMRLIRQDLETQKHISILSDAIKQYFAMKGDLPSNLGVLVEMGILRRGDLKDSRGDSYVYTQKSPNTFSLCANFSTDSKDAQRIHRRETEVPYIKGTSCTSYFVHKDKKGQPLLKIIINTNVDVRK